MVKKLKLMLFLVISFFAFDTPNGMLHAEDSQQSAELKKHHLSICSLFKNEAKFLKEWIEYHRIVGVDHFYLYNNGSTDNYQEVLRPYINQGIVTVIEWPDRLKDYGEESAFKWALSTQVPAYENALVLRGRETKWMFFADVDEFLVPVQEANLKQILEKHDDVPGIILTSECFDVAQINVIPKRNLVIEATELTKTPKQNIQKTIEKMIVKPYFCESFRWPPYRCAFINDLNPAKVNPSEIRINRYINRKKNPWYFEKIKEKLKVDNRQIPIEEKAQLLEVGYEIEDQERVIFKFIPELLKRMGY